MFKSKTKQTKTERHAKEVELIRQAGEIRRGQIARRLGKSRNLVNRDLTDMEGSGVMLCEDECGRISLFEQWFGSRR